VVHYIHDYIMYVNIDFIACLQCFDALGCATRASVICPIKTSASEPSVLVDVSEWGIARSMLWVQRVLA